MKQGECLSCFQEIDDGVWCSMECKRLFLIGNYDPMATIRTMQEFLVERQGKKKEAIKEMKEKGLTATEYIMGTKNDVKSEKAE